MRRSVTCLVLGLVAMGLGAASAAAEEASGKPIEEAFAGKVESVKGRRIRLSWDLSDEKSLDDFVRVNPFLSPPGGGFTATKDGLRARGTGALCLKAIFDGEVHVVLTFTAPKPQDVGVVLIQPGMTDQSLLFAVADTFFCKKDRQEPKTHMITVIGAEDTDGMPGESLFRYLRRSRVPPLTANVPVPVQVRKRGNKNRLEIAGRTMDADDRYAEFPKFQPGIYVLESEMVVARLEIEGRLSVDWLDSEGIAWDREADDGKTLSMEPAKGEPAPEVGRGRGPGRGPSRPAEPGPGASEASRLIHQLGDTDLSADERKKAAAGLTKKNVKYDEMLELIQALYSDDLTTRTLAIGVLKKVTGQTLGYHPRAPEGDRKDAIRDWIRYRRQNKERFQ